MEAERSDNNEKLQEELKRYEERRMSIVSEDEDNYWYNPSIIKDISDGVRKKLIGVVIICSIFIILEAIGAYISNSIAIFTDVAHLFSDLIGFIISLISVNLAKKRASLTHSYGYIRAESVGALFSVIIIWGLTIWILFKSIHRLVYREYDNLNPFYMLASAILGLFVNIIMAVFLHGLGHGHGHGHSHDHDHGHGHDHGHKHDNGHKHDHNHGHGKSHSHAKSHHHGEEHTHTHTEKDDNHNKFKEDSQHKHEIKEKGKHDHDKEHGKKHGHKHDHDHDHDHHDEESRPLTKHSTASKKKKKNLSLVTANDSHNIQAAWNHILGDLIQSIGVVIFSIIIYFKNDWKFLDPVISIVFVIIAVSISIPVAKSVITIMLDTTPRDMDIEKFVSNLKSIKHVTEIHDLHVWNLTHGKPAMTAHILVDDKVDYVLKKATIECRKIGIYHTTIQVERVQDTHKINCEHNVHM